MEAQWIAELGQIAAAMNALPRSANATVAYDLLADALWWSDERPTNSKIAGAGCLRLVFNYRTGLIIDAPKPEFLCYWLAAKKEFPNWPGFDPGRCSGNPQLAAVYRRSAAESLFSLRLAAIGCHLQDEFEGMLPAKVIEKHAHQNEPIDIRAGELYDLTCRAARLAGRQVPSDAWDRVRRSIADGLGVAPELVTKESWLARDLGAS
jgi:hypothetical protein